VGTRTFYYFIVPVLYFFTVLAHTRTFSSAVIFYIYINIYNTILYASVCVCVRSDRRIVRFFISPFPRYRRHRGMPTRLFTRPTFLVSFFFFFVHCLHNAYNIYIYTCSRRLCAATMLRYIYTTETNKSCKSYARTHLSRIEIWCKNWKVKILKLSLLPNKSLVLELHSIMS